MSRASWQERRRGPEPDERPGPRTGRPSPRSHRPRHTGTGTPEVPGRPGELPSCHGVGSGEPGLAYSPGTSRFNGGHGPARFLGDLGRSGALSGDPDRVIGWAARRGSQ